MAELERHGEKRSTVHNNSHPTHQRRITNLLQGGKPVRTVERLEDRQGMIGQ
ncbi:hypothetical protein J6590_105507, partial [Homalodisca vitripennis]